MTGPPPLPEQLVYMPQHTARGNMYDDGDDWVPPPLPNAPLVERTSAAWRPKVSVLSSLPPSTASTSSSDHRTETSVQESTRSHRTAGCEIIPRESRAPRHRGGLPPARELRKQAARGDLQACRDILERAGPRGSSMVNEGQGDGKTALHQAAKGGHTAVAEFLLQCGADVNAQDDYGNNPLYEANYWYMKGRGQKSRSEYGNVSERCENMIRLLLFHGARQSSPSDAGHEERLQQFERLHKDVDAVTGSNVEYPWNIECLLAIGNGQAEEQGASRQPPPPPPPIPPPPTWSPNAAGLTSTVDAFPLDTPLEAPPLVDAFPLDTPLEAPPLETSLEASPLETPLEAPPLAPEARCSERMNPHPLPPPPPKSAQTPPPPPPRPLPFAPGIYEAIRGYPGESGMGGYLLLEEGDEVELKPGLGCTPQPADDGCKFSWYVYGFNGGDGGWFPISAVLRKGA